MTIKNEVELCDWLGCQEPFPSTSNAPKYQQAINFQRELKKYGWVKKIVSKKAAQHANVKPGIVYSNNTLKRTVAILDYRKKTKTWMVAWQIENNQFKVKSLLTKKEAKRLAQNIIIGMNMGLE